MKTLLSRGKIPLVVLVIGIVVAGAAIWYFLIRETAPEPDISDIYYTNESDGRRSLDIFLPSEDDLPAPVVMMLHGSLGNKTNFRKTAREFTPHGFAVVLPSYRIDPITYTDGFCALAWVYTHAEEYGLDTEHVFVIGWSSGGGIAAEMAFVDNSADLLDDCPNSAPADWLDAVVLLAAGSDRWEESGWRTGEPPVTWINGNEPPVLLMHGERDDLIPAEDSTQLAGILEERGDAVELVILPDAGHQFAVPDSDNIFERRDNKGYGDMVDTVLAFLLEQVP